MPLALASSKEILITAKSLISHLVSNRFESEGKEWTDHNFSRLRSFFKAETEVSFYHRPRTGMTEESKEFMWDFLAIQSNGGILLAAESEQAQRQSKGLEHDFEKLLYVFAPLRILISKAATIEEAQQLASSLGEYAKGCCLHFNPGSVFILLFDLWGRDAGSVAYYWQSGGDPSKLELEEIRFDGPLLL